MSADEYTVGDSKPLPAVFVSTDGGETWQECDCVQPEPVSDETDEPKWITVAGQPYYCTCQHRVDQHGEFYCEAEICDCGSAYWEYMG